MGDDADDDDGNGDHDDVDDDNYVIVDEDDCDDHDDVSSGGSITGENGIGADVGIDGIGVNMLTIIILVLYKCPIS